MTMNQSEETMSFMTMYRIAENFLSLHKYNNSAITSITKGAAGIVTEEPSTQGPTPGLLLMPHSRAVAGEFS